MTIKPIFTFIVLCSALVFSFLIGGGTAFAAVPHLDNCGVEPNTQGIEDACIVDGTLYSLYKFHFAFGQTTATLTASGQEIQTVALTEEGTVVTRQFYEPSAGTACTRTVKIYLDTTGFTAWTAVEYCPPPTVM